MVHAIGRVDGSLGLDPDVLDPTDRACLQTHPHSVECWSARRQPSYGNEPLDRRAQVQELRLGRGLC